MATFHHRYPTVNTIAPALIETEMIAGNPQAATRRIPVGRFGTAEEAAEVVVMLACNGYITGQTINVNGGLYMAYQCPSTKCYLLWIGTQ